MSTEREIDDELLGRWLAGELSEEELKEFQASPSYETYKIIAETSSELESFDYSVAEEYKRLHESIEQKKQPKGRIVQLSRYAKISIAAGIAIVLGIAGFFFFRNDPAIQGEVSVFTAQKDTKTIVLPDQSELTLNVSSKINYNKDLWSEKREVHMSGEVYFKVSKGNTFTVNTSHGTVEVLGTEFNIRNRHDITEVICYEGKVKVTDLQNNDIVLTPGMACRMVDGKMEKGWSPPVSEDAEWKNGLSSFHMVPYQTVIEELENQYGVHIDYDKELADKPYVGAFPHDNLEQALKMITNPRNLTFEIKNDSILIR